MRLTAKSEHAVTAMMDLCLHGSSKPIALQELSRCLGISLSYLEQLFTKLRQAGLVRGVRGPGGGYMIARPSTEISIAQILNAVDGHLYQAKRRFSESSRCVANELWSDLSDRLYRFLDNMTLQQFTHRFSGQPLATALDAAQPDHAFQSLTHEVKKG